MVRAGALALTLMLAGCASRSSIVDDVDVADTNARNALAQEAELSSRVDELETERRALALRVDDLESQLADARQKADDASERADNAHERIDWLKSVLNIQ